MKKSYTIQFQSDECTVLLTKAYITKPLNKRLVYLNCDKAHKGYAANDWEKENKSLSLWHRRLKHNEVNAVLQLKDNELIKDTDIQRDSKTESKMHNLHWKESHQAASNSM